MSGLLAGFESEDGLRTALDRFPVSEWRSVETYTPTQPEPQRDSRSPLPPAMFVAGILGFVGFFLLMSYADVQAYPLDIGGRPRFAWPTFVPIAFELGVLCAMAAGFFGYFLVCRLPRLYEPVDECPSFDRAMRDRWFLTVYSEDPRRLAHARELLESLSPATLEEIPG
jgi:hypothetical protein